MQRVDLLTMEEASFEDAIAHCLESVHLNKYNNSWQEIQDLQLQLLTLLQFVKSAHIDYTSSEFILEGRNSELTLSFGKIYSYRIFMEQNSTTVVVSRVDFWGVLTSDWNISVELLLNCRPQQHKQQEKLCSHAENHI